MIAGHLDQFGLTTRDDPRLGGDEVDRPCVRSVRSARRVGPDGQVVFDLVAEVTQRRRVRRGDVSFEMYGGATVLLGPKGEVRYVIAKNVANEGRLDRQHRFLTGAGEAYWAPGDGGFRVARDDAFGLLDGGDGRGSRPAAPAPPGTGGADAARLTSTASRRAVDI